MAANRAARGRYKNYSLTKERKLTIVHTRKFQRLIGKWLGRRGVRFKTLAERTVRRLEGGLRRRKRKVASEPGR